MSDDIVTRLRGVCYDHLLDGHQEAQIVLEDAISEISFLRRQVETWKTLRTIQPFMDAYAKARWGND